MTKKEIIDCLVNAKSSTNGTSLITLYVPSTSNTNC